ncbi:hypothetical protein U9R90_27205 [Streptomyces sp. E11-3]|uniref:hypothetical protein n=1 Tax=Streptomyces sp. E11-3 TaxID=3110112 RepID=UPI0039816A89
MNFRSLTRGDAVVIGAAVLLFIASFLDSVDCEGPGGCDSKAWDNGGLLAGVYLLGILSAALIVVGRALTPPRKIIGLDLGQIGIAFAIATAWTSIFSIGDPAGFLDLDGIDAGVGLIFGLIAGLALAGAAIATPLVPALSAPLMGATPAPMMGQQPYGGQPGMPQQGGYGYPGAQQQPYGGQPQPGHQQPSYGGQQQPSYGGQPGQADQAQFQKAPEPAQAQQPQAAAQQQPAGDFSPFWFAVPVARPLYAEDGSPTPIAELAPGTWYLAVEQRGPGLVAQTQDGRRGVLQDTTGIQRG